MRQALLCGLGVLLCIGCRRAPSNAPRAGTTADSLRGPRPTFVSYDVSLLLETGDRPRARIRAARMAQYEFEDSTYAVFTAPDTQRVRTTVFNTRGDSSAVIHADSIRYYSEDKRAEAFGAVVVRTVDNKRLYTEHLTWQQEDRQIRTRRFVRIVTPTERVQGNGLVADETLDSYRLGRFSAAVDVEDDA